VEHLLKFAFFGLNMHPVVRATRVFIFLVGLGITRYTTRRGTQRRFFLRSSGNWRRRRRRHHAHAWLDRKHSEAHASHTCELRSDALSTCLLVLFLLFLKSRLCWDCRVPFRALVFRRLGRSRDLHAANGGRRRCTELDASELGHALCDRISALQLLMPPGLAHRRSG
jgi:hypothetical protein